VYTSPEIAHILLDKITEVTINYLQAQADAGAACIDHFGYWAGILPPAHYHRFSTSILRFAEAITTVPLPF